MSCRANPRERKGSPRKRAVLVPVIVATAAAAIAVVVAVLPTLGGAAHPGSAGAAAPNGQGPTTTQDPDQQQAAQRLGQLARRTPNDPMAMGKVDAPVVMIAYSDFQCPFCGKFARDTEPALVKQFVDTGTLRIEWRDFPYLGRESTTAARAGRAAAAQGRFWAFHDASTPTRPRSTAES